MSEDIFRFSQLGLLWLSSGCRGQMLLSQSLSHVRLFATPWDCSTPGFPVHHPLPGACSNSCPLSQWCHPTISPFATPISYCPNLSQHQGLFQWVSSSHQVAKVLEASTSVLILPVNIQGWFPLRLTGLISLQSRELSGVFSAPQLESINCLVLSLLYGPTFTPIHDFWKKHSFDYTELCQQSDVSAF